MKWIQGLLAGAAMAWTGYALIPTAYYKYGKKWTTQSKGILLTFDDGPDPIYTPQLLELLAQYEIHAAFFLRSDRAEDYPYLVTQIRQGGHLVAFHGEGHENPALCGPRKTLRSLQRGSAHLNRLAPDAAQLYRPPHGTCNLTTLHWLRRTGSHMLLWSVIAQDWRADETAVSIAEKLCSRCHEGAVVLLHDCGQGTGGAPGAPGRMLQALRLALPVLQQQYKFAEPEEVIYGIHCTEQEKTTHQLAGSAGFDGHNGTITTTRP